MRNILLIAGTVLLLFFSTNVQSQTSLSWLSSFIPSWSNGNTSGSANNIGGSGINCNVTSTIFGGGSYQLALGSSGAQTPTVSGATFTVPGTSSRLQVTPNYSNNTAYTNIVMNFTSMATNVTFRIVDIDKSSSTSTSYFDRVTVTGTNGVTTFYPTITKYDAVTDPNFLVISGNVAHVNTTSGQAGNTPSDATDQRGTVTVNFGSAIINSITIRYDNAPGADANPASQAIAVGSVSFTNSALPVTLTSFSGHSQGQAVILNWKTQEEINIESYSVQRNTGSSWETIGTVPASGNSGITNYTYTDLNPQGNILLYRLKINEQDNRNKYSSIVRINSSDTKASISGYPNPFTTQVNISIGSLINQQVSVNIYEATGKTVKSELKNLYAGNNNFTINGLEELSRGIYFVEVKDSPGKSLGRTQLLKN